MERETVDLIVIVMTDKKEEPDPLESPREGRGEREIEGWREVASDLDPRFLTDRRMHCMLQKRAGGKSSELK